MPREQILLLVVSFVTSTVTGILGLGGGLLLVAVMPAFLPPQAVIPIHGAVQLASNTSRALLALRHACWRIIGAFLAGAALGALMGVPAIGALPTEAVSPLLGSFVLLIVWIPRRFFPRQIPGGFFAAGLVQTFLSLFVGATGPINGALLARQELSRDQTVVTHAGMMTFLHLAKIFAFALSGFAFSPYLGLLAGLTLATILGSWAGTRLRPLVSEKAFRPIFKGLLTLLALRLLLSAL